MDDLDKIGDESTIQEEHSRQNTHSEENLFSGKSSDAKQITTKDTNDNLNISDEETPPPLFPRKRQETRPKDMNYDTLVVPPNVAHRLRPFPYSPGNTYGTVQVAPSTASGSTQNGQKPEGNLKHRYANLDGEIPQSQQQQSPVRPRSGDHEEDPYDLLAPPTRNSYTENRNGGVDNIESLDTISVNMAGRNSPNTANIGPDSKNAYDTVVLRNSPHANTTNGNIQDQDRIFRDVSPGSPDQANGISAYEHHVPRSIPVRSPLNTVRGNVANVVSSIEKSRDTSPVVPPILPPKTHKKDGTMTSRQSAALPSLRSSSPVFQTNPKYSPPVAPRIKRPPKTPPQQHNNNVDLP